MQFNSLIPELSVSNFDNSIKFYRDIVGFSLEFERPENKFAFLSIEGSQIMIEQQNGQWDTGLLEYPYGRGINFAIKISSLAGIIESLQANNYPIKLGPKENWYRQGEELLGNKEILVLDPDGYC